MHFLGRALLLLAYRAQAEAAFAPSSFVPLALTRHIYALVALSKVTLFCKAQVVNMRGLYVFVLFLFFFGGVGGNVFFLCF